MCYNMAGHSEVQELHAQLEPHIIKQLLAMVGAMHDGCHAYACTGQALIVGRVQGDPQSLLRAETGWNSAWD